MNIEQIIIELFRIRSTHQRNAKNHAKATRLNELASEVSIATYIGNAIVMLDGALKEEKKTLLHRKASA